MTRVLILLVLANFCFAQNDTIFTKQKLIIPCTISLETYNSLEYTDAVGKTQWIDLFSIEKYSKNGIRIKGGAKPKNTMYTKTDTVDISAELLHLRTCMSKFHTQYTAGFSFMLIGGSLMGTSLFFDQGDNLRTGLGIGGAVFVMVGIVTSIDAHKWMQRAGLGISGKGNSVEIVYRLK